IKKFRLFIVALVFSAGLFGTLSFTDNYFEISKNLDIFSTLLRDLDLYFVDETNPGTLVKTAIDAMLKSLDPYTNYIPESDMEDYRFMTTGQYGGIGALIQKRGDYVMISEPYENSPALKAGLLAGDIIYEVDGKSAQGKTTAEMSTILKGQPNTKVKLLIHRLGVEEPLSISVTREEVKINDVPYFGVIAPKVGYIKLNSFTETASREVRAALKALKEKNHIESVVLDLRGNGGGLLREAVNIVNIFIEKGVEVVHTRGKIKDWDKSHKTLNNPIDPNIPLIILINGGSASASEIVAGSIQDFDRGVLIGTNSFGKGLVQQTRNLSYNAKLKLTVAKYYIPSGRCIQRLDYSHKNMAGKAEAIPDSLINEFKTRNGRPVFDGAGIEPDINMVEPKLADITRSLLTKHLIFDYATLFRQKRDSIPTVSEFVLTDEDYKDFTDYLADKDYQYTTKSEQLLKKLEEATKNDKSFDAVREEYEALAHKIDHDKKSDLDKFKDEIKMMLHAEIASRYTFQKGRIQASLLNDPNIRKATEVLSDSTLYHSILNGDFHKEPSGGE
ncbi:MAG: S41 family peptidase, partial [Flavobacteriales bacterium]